VKRFISSLLLAVLLLSLNSCATTHLWRWGLGKTSAVHTVDNEQMEAFVKPSSTIVGTPLALAWDVATFPFQLIFWVFPYGDHYMVPAAKKH
jgi:hypothetical protein